MRKVVALFGAVMLVGCQVRRQTPQERREDFVSGCIHQGQNAVDCANAAQQTIPENAK